MEQAAINRLVANKNSNRIPRTSDRDRLELELRLKSPKRPGHVDAADPAHLPLFVAANEPPLL